jgi:Ca2+-binding RTX toxin-like protein
VGGGGSDLLRGGEGADHLWGDAEPYTRPPYQNLSAGSFHGTSDDDLYGGAGNDHLNGGQGDDTLSGEDGWDTMYGGAGNDLLYGGADFDVLHGDHGNDALWGDGGNDQIYGEAGTDLLFGGAGNDGLHGDDGNDALVGDTGNDVLDGGAGDDTLTGGADVDNFFFRATIGHDVVTDFQPGVDRITFFLTDFTGWNDLFNGGDRYIAQEGADAVIHYYDQTVTLLNTQVSSLSASDFVFMNSVPV